jgi:magnesium chelatase subunit I
VHDFEPLIAQFDEGLVVDTGSDVPSKAYASNVKNMEGLAEALTRLDSSRPAEKVAAGTEFVLEGLHLNRRLNRDRVEGRFRYRS